MFVKASQTWASVAERLPILLHQLASNVPIVRDGRGKLPKIPEKGIYVLYGSC